LTFVGTMFSILREAHHKRFIRDWGREIQRSG
jgi:hypothetical protein